MAGKRQRTDHPGQPINRPVPSPLLWWIAAIACLLLVVLLHTFPIVNTDFFWHIATGKLIIETGVVPHADPFSYTSAGTKWITHEWLFEVVTWLVYSAGSFQAVSLLKVAVLLFTIWIPISLWRGSTVSPLWIFVCASTSVIMAISRSFWRPHLLGILMTAIFIMVLEDYVRRRNNRLWVLPILTILWVNWHSGVVLGVALIFIYAAIEFFSRSNRSEIPEPHPTYAILGLFGVISLACLLLNPNTIDAIIYPFILVQSYSSTYGQVASFWELQPITLDMMPSFWFSGILAITGIIASWKNTNPRYAIILFILFLASLLRLRLIELYIPAFIAFGPGMIQGLTDYVNRKFRPTPRIAVNIVLGIGVVGIVVAMSLNSLNGPPAPGLSNDTFPVACADWVEENDPPGYMYNDIDIGGYLIFRLYPEYRIFWDNRLDVFEPLFKRLVEGETVEDVHYIDWVIDVNSVEYNPYISDQWALMSFDKHHSLYIKRTGAASGLIGDQEYRILRPGRPEDYFRNVRDWPPEITAQLVTELDRFLEENDTHYGKAYAACVLILLGDEYLVRGRNLLDEGLRSDSNYLQYLYYDAFYDYASDDLGSAEGKIRRLLFWYPRSNELSFLLARILAAKHEYGRAKGLIERVISRGYSSPAVFSLQAEIMHELNDDNGAVTALESYFKTVTMEDLGSREYADAIALGQELTGGG